ncbi:GABA permease, partial [Escherichia coli]|nr:GABA permease [Escherichia coli]
MGQSPQPHELGGGLKSRHVTMLSIAGVIGVSLFVRSSVVTAEAGPPVLLDHLLAGILVVILFLLLPETPVSTAVSGFVFSLAAESHGRRPGFYLR